MGQKLRGGGFLRKLLKNFLLNFIYKRERLGKVMWMATLVYFLFFMYMVFLKDNSLNYP